MKRYEMRDAGYAKIDSSFVISEYHIFCHPNPESRIPDLNPEDDNAW